MYRSNPSRRGIGEMAFVSKKTNAAKLKARAKVKRSARRHAHGRRPNPLRLPKDFKPASMKDSELFAGFLDIAVDQMLLQVLRASGIRQIVKDGLLAGGGIEIVGSEESLNSGEIDAEFEDDVPL